MLKFLQSFDVHESIKLLFTLYHTIPYLNYCIGTYYNREVKLKEFVFDDVICYLSLYCAIYIDFQDLQSSNDYGDPA